MKTANKIGKPIFIFLVLLNSTKLLMATPFAIFLSKKQDYLEGSVSNLGSLMKLIGFPYDKNKGTYM